MDTAKRLREAALYYVERRGYNWLHGEERRLAAKADHLLKIAADPYGSPAERALAAERAAEALRKIYSISLPELTWRELETRTSRALPPSSR